MNYGNKTFLIRIYITCLELKGFCENGCDTLLKLYTHHTAHAREQTNNTREDMETRRLIITTENQTKFANTFQANVFIVV